MNNPTQYDLLKTEFLLTQQQMDKYDQLSTTIKAWTVTLWVASSGWAFQVKRKEMLILGILIVLILGFLDVLNKIFRQDYKARRDEVAKILRVLFKSGTVPNDASAPNLPKHNFLDGARNLFSAPNFFLVHVALPYLILTATSLVMYLRY